MLENPQKIANRFNEYFVNIGKELADKIPFQENTFFSHRVSNSFSLYDTTANEVHQIINTLKANKGSRKDDPQLS